MTINDSISHTTEVAPDTVTQREFVWLTKDHIEINSPTPSPRISFEEMFGRSAMRASESSVPQPLKQITPTSMHEYGINILMLLIFALYAGTIHRYRNVIGSTLKVLVNHSFLNKIITEQNISFRICARTIMAIGLLDLYVVVMALLMDQNVIPEMPIIVSVNFTLSLLTIVCLLAIFSYKAIILWLTALLTRDYKLIADLKYFNKIMRVIYTIFFTPIVLIGLFCNPNVENIVIYAGAIMLIILTLNFIWLSYEFFIQKNVSTLQWILYLCTVEILPISFFFLIAIR